MRYRYGLYALLTSLVAVACWLYYQRATATTAEMLCQADVQMQWLKQEFQLSDAQFREIQKLNAGFEPLCDKRCEQIAAARAKLDRLIDTNSRMSPEVLAAFQEYSAVEESCRVAMLEHVYQVAAVISGEQGARYLRMMKQHILFPGLDHSRMHPDTHR